MEKELVVLVEEAPEGGFTAKALGTALFTDGETLEEVEANAGGSSLLQRIGRLRDSNPRPSRGGRGSC